MNFKENKTGATLPPRSERSSNFELLRIFAMLMIVGSHAAQHSGAGSWSLMTSTLNANLLSLYLLGSYGQLGVALFVIISSWFLCDKKGGTHIEKAARIYLQALFVSVAIFIFVKAAGFIPLRAKDFAKTLLTPAYSGYWFVRTYILFYLIIPFLQEYLLKAEEKDVRNLFIILTIFIGAMNFLIPSVAMEFGNVGGFAYIFVAVFFLKKHERNFLEKHCIPIFVSLLILMWSGMISARLFGRTMGLADETIKKLLIRIFATRHIFLLAFAMSFFYIFKNHVKIGRSKAINAVAGTTLGVYIFHENPLFCSYGETGLCDTALLFEKWLKLGKHFYGGNLFPLYFILCVAVVFAASSVLESTRQILCSAVKKVFAGKC